MDLRKMCKRTLIAAEIISTNFSKEDIEEIIKAPVTSESARKYAEAAVKGELTEQQVDILLKIAILIEDDELFNMMMKYA